MTGVTNETISVLKRNRKTVEHARKITGQTTPEIADISRILAENSSDIVIRVQLLPEEKLIYISPGCLKVFGYTAEEFYEDANLVSRSFHPDDVPIFFKFLRTDRDLDGRSAILRWIRKDGRIVWTEQTKTVIRNKKGQALENCFIVRDITERKLAEEKLLESQKFVTSLLENAPYPTMVINPDTSIRYVNPAWEELNGWTLDEVIGLKTPYPWWLEDSNQKTCAKPQWSMEHKGAAEVIARKKNGDKYWIFMKWTPVTHNGELQYLLISSMDITERKLAEEALKESEDKFSRAFHASPNAICISTMDEGRFIDVNESLIKSLGYSREELIGRTSLELNIWSPQDRDRIRRLVEENKHVKVEPLKFRTKAGEIRTGLFSAESITIGNRACLISVISDITESKKVEERLRLVSSVTQQVSDATIVINLDYRITYMNQAAEKMFGYTAQEVMGKPMLIFNAHPIPKERIGKIFDAIRSGQIWSGTAEKKKKDGTVIINKIELGPLYDENGRLCSYIDVEHDITEQKAMEARLQDQKNLVESILSTMPEGVIVIDSNDRIILANQAFFDIFRIRKSSLANKSLDTIIPRDKLSNLYFGVLLGQTTNNSLEFRYEARGIEKIISCCATKMDGNKLLLTFTDISQERDEEEKLYLTDRLASLGEMAAGLAHELNNPLTGILALSQLLLDANPPEEHREDLQCINSEAKRAAEIVKNVLLFARNNNYSSGQALANEVVTELLRLRQHEHKSANILVVTDLQNDLPRVNIDKYQLQQVCLNIILNAESAIRETGKPGSITIKTERSADFINIVFSDTGCGIKKQVLSRIFDPFFTTKDIGKGTGLGLSICYSIVVKHGGKINVRSRVNEGSTFTVRLPVTPESNTAGKE